MAEQNQVRTYRVTACVIFKKTNERFGGLSNMAAGFPLQVNGIDIRTSEALYQACRFPHKPEVQWLIIRERSPMTAKMKGKPYRGETRPDWDQTRVNIMRWCLRVKLAQNSQKFSSLLLVTGDRPIVEESRRDDFWGAKPAGDGTLVGMNVLGRLLMELREKLQGGDQESLTRVEPLNIPDFVLCGTPIGVIEASRYIPSVVPTRHPEPLFADDILACAATNRSVAGITTAVPQTAPPILNDEKDSGRPALSAIPKECKRLAEVDFPIAEVSKHAVREKSIRHGHPSTLHLWWARRPLASSRAVLLALLLPDPCDPRCLDAFKRKASALLSKVGCGKGKTDQELQRGLLKFIADFANWDLAANRTYLDVGRALVKAAHGEEAPLIVDPFAGGGSIPLEALRLGCEAFASDLNPVACLILKVMLEDIPRHGVGLAEELRMIGGEIKRKAERELADLYPKDPDGATPIAYLWARTVRCEAPKCGAEIPLMRSFWLCKKSKRKRALRHRIERPEGQPPHVEFETFEPNADKDVRAGTVTRAKATCLCCGTVVPPERVRAQLAAQSGGGDVVFDEEGHRTGGARMTAVVILRPGETGRHYRLPTDAEYSSVHRSQVRLAKIVSQWERDGKQGLCPVPDEPLPPIGTLGFRVQRYGMLQWGDLFTARQKVVLVELVRLMRSQSECKCRECVAAVLDRCANQLSHVSRWNVPGEKVEGTFSRQALPIVWDYAEVNPFGNATGSYDGALNWVAGVTEAWPKSVVGQVQPADATDHPLPDQAAGVWFTDPPYYDAIPYADLSDFFFVWLKRTLPNHTLLRDPFDPDNPLSPKTAEAVQDETKSDMGRLKDREWFEETMAKAFAEGRRVLREDGIGSVIFAHKTTEGWEALLAGMIRGGWTITGSWPIATEMGTRLRARDSAALATSVHLICRPRPDDAPVGDWVDVLQELPRRVTDWMDRLQEEGIRGADLVFACIGPALEVFSRYRAVETVEGRAVKLAEYLEKVWEVVGRAALEQVLGSADVRSRADLMGSLEEDARLTALFLWTLQSTETADGHDNKEEEDDEIVAKIAAKGLSLPFDVVRRFAQPMGIDLNIWNGRIIGQEKGVVRLLPITERASGLFGEDGSAAAADWIESNPGESVQATLFPELDAATTVRSRRSGRKTILDGDAELQEIKATVLDRVHAAMLLQASGHANALRTLVSAEQDRGPEFLRLANALSALYPHGSLEKRLLDAMLLAVPR